MSPPIKVPDLPGGDPQPAAAPAAPLPAPVQQAEPPSNESWQQQGLQQIDSQPDTGERAFRRAFLGGSSIDPDSYARALKLASKLGRPADAVYDTLDTADPGQVRAVENDYQRLFRESPALRSWFDHKPNAAVSHDDIPALAFLEKAVKPLGERGFWGELLAAGFEGNDNMNAALYTTLLAESGGAIDSGFGDRYRGIQKGVSAANDTAGQLAGQAGALQSVAASTRNSGLGLAAGAIQSAAVGGALRAGSLADQQVRDLMDSLPAPTRFIVHAASRYGRNAAESKALMSPALQRYDRRLGSQQRDVTSAWQGLVGSFDTFDPGAWLAHALDFGSEGTGLLADLVPNPLDLFGNADRFVTDLTGMARQSTEQAAYMLLPVAYGAAGAAITGPWGMAIGSGAATALVEYSSELRQGVTDLGYDPNEALDLITVFSDPVKRAWVRDRAARKGVGVATVQMLFAAGAGKMLAGVLSVPETSLVRKAVAVTKAGVAETGREMVGEQLEELYSQAFRERFDLSKIDAGDMLMEGFIAGPESVSTAITGAMSRKIQSRLGLAEAAQREITFITGVETLKESKAYKRAPDHIRDLVDKATRLGPDGETLIVSFDRDTWDNLHQQAGLNPEAALREILGDRAPFHYAESGSTGNIDIPAADLLSAATRRDDVEEVARNARFDPELPTVAEAEAEDEAVQADVTEAVGQATTLFQEDRQIEQDRVANEKALAELRGTDPNVAPPELPPDLAKAAEGLTPAQLKQVADVAEQAAAAVAAGMSEDQAVQAATETLGGAGKLLSTLGGDAAGRAMAAVRADPEGFVRAARIMAAERRLADIKTRQSEISAQREAGVAAAEKVAAKLAAEAEATGLYSRAEARAMASALTRGFSVLAERHGLDLADLVARYPIDFSRLARDGAGPEQRGRVVAGDKGASLFQGARGFTQAERLPGGGLRISIAALENADPSTLIHEMGHGWTHILRDLVAQPNAPESLKVQVGAMLDVMGILPGAPLEERLADYDARLARSGEIRNAAQAEGRALTAPERKELRGLEDPFEKLARAHEAYVRRGIAPTPELRSVFSMFKRWMLAIYETLRALRVKLTPETIAFFDSLYATEDEILAAEAEGGVKPLADEELAGLSEEDKALLREADARAGEVAREAMQREEFRRMEAQKKALRDTEMEPVRAELRAQANQHRAVIAVSVMQKGTMPDGSPLPDGMNQAKIGRASAVEAYGSSSDTLRELEAAGLLTDEDGIPISGVANALGADNAEAVGKMLIGAVNIDRAIEAEARARVKREHPELAASRDVRKLARESVANEEQIKALLLRQKLLAKGRRAAYDSVEKLPAVRRQAKRILDALPMHMLQPGRYAAAAQRASTKAAQRARVGDFDGAAAARDQEILNRELHRIALKMKEESVRHRNALAKMLAPDRQGTLGKAGFTYQDQMNSLLDGYSFAALSEAARTRVKSLGVWLEENQKNRAEDGDFREFDVPERVLEHMAGLRAGAEGALRTHWRELTLEQLREVRDTAEMIWHLAKTKDNLTQIQQERTLQVAVAELVEAGQRSSPLRKDAEQTLGLDEHQKKLRPLEEADAWHKKLSTVVRLLDGLEDGGVWARTILRPLNNAADAEDTRLASEAARLRSVFDWLPDWRTAEFKRKYHKGLFVGGISHEEILGVALHYGNQFGRQRLSAGLGFTEEQINFCIAQLDEHDVAFLNALYKYYDSFWPEITDQRKRITGVVPEKVEAIAYDTPGGRVTGGYHTLKYSGKRSRQLTIEEQAREARRGVYTRSQTRDGYNISRKDQVDAVVRVDLGVTTEHVREVVHDLTHHEMLLDLNRIIGHSDIQELLRARMGESIVDLVDDTLKAVAGGQIGARNWFERAANKARANVSTSMLGFKVMTGLANITGLSQTIQGIGWEYYKRGQLWYARSAMEQESVKDWVYNSSPFMRNRPENMSQTLYDLNRDLGGSGLEGQLNGLQEAGWGVLVWTQIQVDMPTWLGMYLKATEGYGASHEEAVAQADQQVRDTQGSAQLHDLARIQRQSPLFKLFQSFYFFQNTQYQRTALSVAEARRSDSSLGPTAARALINGMLLFVVPAFLQALSTLVFRGREDDDENVAWWLFMETMRETAGMAAGIVVGVREFSQMIRGFLEDSGPRDYSGPAAMRIFPATYKLAQQIWQWELDDGLRRALINFGGVWKGIPADQLNKTWDGVEANLSNDVHGVRRLTAPVVGTPTRR